MRVEPKGFRIDRDKKLILPENLIYWVNDIEGGERYQLALLRQNIAMTLVDDIINNRCSYEDIRNRLDKTDPNVIGGLALLWHIQKVLESCLYNEMHFTKICGLLDDIADYLSVAGQENILGFKYSDNIGMVRQEIEQYINDDKKISPGVIYNSVPFEVWQKEELELQQQQQQQQMISNTNHTQFNQGEQINIPMMQPNNGFIGQPTIVQTHNRIRIQGTVIVGNGNQLPLPNFSTSLSNNGGVSTTPRIVVQNIRSINNIPINMDIDRGGRSQ